ncbi:MAG TPA: M56 family metallopeptidase [Microbacteriaceae bacterium]
MLLTSFALAALALALAWPVPILLARAQWPSRAPATALIVWQSIALAGGLSMIGAMLTYGLAPFGADLVNGLRGFAGELTAGALPVGANFSQMFALSGAILLSVHLLLSLVTTFVQAERSRRRHRQLVTLLSDPMPERPGTRLIDHAAPVAYCLPGTTRSVTVLSAGLIALLDEEQLRAVIAHETAHASQRHHLVLLAFRAWRRALPWFPIATRAHEAVAMLVEMMADDQARRAVSDAALVRSIVLVASESSGQVGSSTQQDSTRVPVPSAGSREAIVSTFDRQSALDRPLAADGPTAARRISRIVDARVPLSAFARGSATTCAVALIAVPTVLLLAPAFA